MMIYWNRTNIIKLVLRNILFQMVEMNADYLTVAIRTKKGDKKFSSLSFILIDVNEINNGDKKVYGTIYKSKMRTQG